MARAPGKDMCGVAFTNKERTHCLSVSISVWTKPSSDFDLMPISQGFSNRILKSAYRCNGGAAGLKRSFKRRASRNNFAKGKYSESE
jgi:hypothetical protein